MKIINYYLASAPLCKAMPKDLDKTITASEHCKRFGALITCDVWTADGYLVTAVREDGITHHLRKESHVYVAEISPSQVLHYKSNSRSQEFGL